jgi:pimeloyl-ACP methyl ester carboxylesterase
LVHGGGCAASCWDKLVPLLDEPTIAVDLPGRGNRPADLATVAIGDFVATVVDEIVTRDLRDVVLVGHSLAGVTLPGVAGAVPDRLRHLVFVSCSVPADGMRVLDTLDPTIRLLAEQAGAATAVGTLPPEIAAAMFCNDMDEELTQFTLERLVPETSRVIFEPVDLSGLRNGVPKTYVRLARDASVTPAQQDMMIANLGGADVVDLDCGHLAMISQPHALAAIINAL